MADTILVEVAIALLALAIIGSVASHLGQSVIPAYILAGILVGPYVPTDVGGISLRLVTNSEFLTTVAELGIILLLFFLGLEFSVETLLKNRVRLTAVGGIDLVANALVGIGIGIAFGYGLQGIILIAGIVYISSSAIITKALTEMGWLANPESEVILGTLVVEDIVIAVYLAIVSAVVVGGGSASDATMTVAQSFVFLTVLAGGAHLGSDYIDPIFDADSDEIFLLRVVGVTVLVGAVAVTIGVSEAVAAFFVGTAFHGSDLVERLERLLAPLRDIFAALFFFSIGVTTNLLVVVDVGLLLIIAVLASTIVKIGSGYASGRAYGLTGRRSMRVGLGLVPRGEFSLIIATLAAASTVPSVRETVPAFAVGYVLVMSIIGSLGIQYSRQVMAVFGDLR